MITMQEIAEKVGVSRSTVSYVLNKKDAKNRISEGTREKILETAQKHGYLRNAIAQSVKKGKTNIIGFIGSLSRSYSVEIIAGINDVLLERGYFIKIFPCHETERMEAIAKTCLEYRLDGIACFSLWKESLDILYKELSPYNIPTILVDSRFKYDDWCSQVITDDFKGAFMATEYLLNQGHRRIVHLTHTFKTFAAERYEGFKSAFEKNGYKLPEKNLYTVELELDLGNRAFSEISKMLFEMKPTAVFCGTDYLAATVISVAREHGINVPDDLSVFGYGGLEYSHILSPPLSTVEQPFFKLGENAARLLLKTMNKEDIPKEIRLPVNLRIRKSTKKNE